MLLKVQIFNLGFRFTRMERSRSQWPLACWDCVFESHRGHWWPSLVIVACCQVEVSATNFSLVQRSPTDCGTNFMEMRPAWKSNSLWTRQEISLIYWTRRFITLFTAAHHLPLCWVRSSRELQTKSAIAAFRVEHGQSTRDKFFLCCELLNIYIIT